MNAHNSKGRQNKQENKLKDEEQRYGKKPDQWKEQNCIWNRYRTLCRRKRDIEDRKGAEENKYGKYTATRILGGNDAK